MPLFRALFGLHPKQCVRARVPPWIICICVYVIDGLQQQLAAYVSWVNSQLKRKPGLKPITDLRHDLQDGVVLTQLIEIVGKCTQAYLHTLMFHTE